MEQTSIIHLSDLHLRRKSPKSTGQWNTLCNELARKKPDIIVVTGDLVDHPNPWELSEAKNKLTQLSERLNIKFPMTSKDTCGIIVIPGNHDYRFYGNLLHWKRPWRKHFGAICSQGYCNRPRNLVIYGFDTCDLRPGKLLHIPRRLWTFARGYVGMEQINNFQEWCQDQYRTDPSFFDEALKIALMHHHPLPIAEAEQGHNLSIRKFAGMDNGGYLLGSLVQEGFRIALHGHDHWPQVAEFTVHCPEKDKSSICVVAGGSSSHSKKPPAGHCYNHLILNVDRKISINTYTSKANRYERTTTHEIPYWKDIRRQILDKESSEASVRFEEIKKTVTIDETGLAGVTLLFSNGRVAKNSSIHSLDIQLPLPLPRSKFAEQVEIKALVRLERDLWRKVNFKYKSNNKHKEGKNNHRSCVVTSVDLGRELSENTRFDVKLEYSVPNAMVTSTERHQLVYGIDHSHKGEYVSLPIDHLTRDLQLEVQFISSYDECNVGTPQLAKLQDHELAELFTIGRPFPILPEEPQREPQEELQEEPQEEPQEELQGEPQEELQEEPQEELKEELDMQQRWPFCDENQLEFNEEIYFHNQDVSIDENNRVVTLKRSIRDPLVGCRYYLAWELPSFNQIRPQNARFDQDESKAEKFRNEHVMLSPNLSQQLEHQPFGEFLKESRDRLRKAIENKGNNNKPSHDGFLEVGLAMFHPYELDLRFIAGNFEHDEAAKMERYPCGEGVIGHAFKTKKSTIWWRSPVGTTQKRLAQIWNPKVPDYPNDHECVLAFPLIYPIQPEFEPEPVDIPDDVRNLWPYVVGVLVFRSSTAGSAITVFTSKDSETALGLLCNDFSLEFANFI